jgi:hypothetical protein
MFNDYNKTLAELNERCNKLIVEANKLAKQRAKATNQMRSSWLLATPPFVRAASTNSRSRVDEPQ